MMENFSSLQSIKSPTHDKMVDPESDEIYNDCVIEVSIN
jgi:hypothetical protein